MNGSKNYYEPYFFALSLKNGRKTRQTGAELVEMSLILGFFVILVIMVFEMMMMLYAYNTTGALSREAMRYAVVRGAKAAEDSTRHAGLGTDDAPADQGKIQAYIDGKKIHPGTFVVTASWPDGKDIRDPIQITVSHVYQPIMAPGNFFYTPTFQATAQGVVIY